MQAPTPISLIKIEETEIDINSLKEKYEFDFEGYKIIIGLYNENIYFYCNLDEEKKFYAKKTYDEIIQEVPIFKIHTITKDIFKIITNLLNLNKFSIKADGKEKLKLVLKIMNFFGAEEEYEFILFKKKLCEKMRIIIMEKKIENLENQIALLIEEKKEMKNKINSISDENEAIKKELKELKNLIYSSGTFPIVDKGSKIIKNSEEIKFVLKEIENKGIEIKDMKLLYRATKDGDKMEVFHSKCDKVKNTLMIIETKEGYKFGGFTKVGWKNVQGEDIKDDSAFCFSINLNKIYKIKNPKNALHCQSFGKRPSFGSISYIFLLGNNFLSEKSSHVEKMVDYEGENTSKEINGGKDNFQVSELEVFQIIN